MALYIPHSIFHLTRLLYFRPEIFGPYYVYEGWWAQDYVCKFCKTGNFLPYPGFLTLYRPARSLTRKAHSYT
jgi:hypothetical protein